MKKHTRVAFSLLLVVCMLISGMPIVTPAGAVGTDNHASEAITETLPVEAAATDTAVLNDDAIIVEEDTTLRGEYEKHFLMSDGSYQVALYNEPVHKMEDSKWVEIDNTLTLKTATDGTVRYATTDGLADVSFSQSFDDQLITMQQDDYSVSWGVQAFSSSLSMNTSVELVQPVQAELVTSDLSTFNLEDQKTLATKSSSTIQYRNALRQNVDLEYVVLPSRVKENIILQSAQDISYYVVTVYAENLSARLLENREIEFYNDSDDVIFTMTSPYMYDSVGELSEDITVEMVSKGTGCYYIKMTPNSQWLNDESRVYPVVIDPQVSVDTTRTNIIDNYVLEGGGVQNRNLDRLYIGNRSEGRTRAFIKYNTMPTIPEGANIVKATVYLKLTSGTSSAANASAYKVTGGDWASNTITWDNMPAASIALETNISHNSASYYYFSCLRAVRGWYSGAGRTTGTNANYGFMVRYYDETVDDYNAFYSADCTTESLRPLLRITYFYASVPEGGTHSLTRPDVTGTVTWTSSDTSLATVNSSGVVSGIKAGTVTITASVSGSIVKTYTVFVRIPDGVYRIKSGNIGLYLGTYGGTSENTSVRMLAYSNTGDTRFQQLWKVTYLDNGYYSIRPMYQLSMGLHATSNNVDITTTSGPNDTLGEVVSNSRWGISSTSDRTAYNINNVGTSSLAMRYADGATSPGLGVITAINSGTSASFRWKMELVAPVNYSEDYRYKLLALNENGIERYDYFTDTSAIIRDKLGDDIYTNFYREISTNDAIQLLSQSDIFIIHTHGWQEGFYLSTSSYITMSDVVECDLSGLKFALLLTCSTGKNFSNTHISNNTPVNIVEQMVCSGAETVVGFSETTYVSDCNRFAVDFAEASIEDGNTVYSGILNIDYTYYLKDMSEISRVGGNTALRLS